MYQNVEEGWIYLWYIFQKILSTHVVPTITFSQNRKTKDDERNNKNKPRSFNIGP